MSIQLFQCYCRRRRLIRLLCMYENIRRCLISHGRLTMRPEGTRNVFPKFRLLILYFRRERALGRCWVSLPTDRTIWGYNLIKRLGVLGTALDLLIFAPIFRTASECLALFYHLRVYFSHGRTFSDFPSAAVSTVPSSTLGHVRCQRLDNRTVTTQASPWYAPIVKSFMSSLSVLSMISQCSSHFEHLPRRINEGTHCAVSRKLHYAGTTSTVPNLLVAS